MKFTTHFQHAPARPNAIPKSVPISGDFPSVAHAKRAAVSMATEDPNFTGWCVAFVIEDENGQQVAEWSKDQAQRR